MNFVSFASTVIKDAMLGGSKLTLSPRRWLLIPIEIKARELDGAALLSLEAAARGWGIIIGDFKTLKNLNMPEGLLVSRWVKPGITEKFQHLHQGRKKIAAWCDEGLVYLNAHEYGRRKVDLDAYNLTEAFFAWGRHQADDMVYRLGCSPKKMNITGNPRFDLHRPDYRKLLTGRVERIRQQMGPFILVNTKFSAFNGAYSVEDSITSKKSKRQITNESEESDYRDYVVFHERGFECFTQLVAALSQEFLQYKIVIRPHPSEQTYKWRSIASRLPNVFVAGDGNVAEWLLAADAVIHNNCTTGIECFLLGKIPISYRPVRDERFDMRLPGVVSEDASTLEEVLTLVSNQLKRGNDQVQDRPDRWEIVSHHIANFAGPPACPQIMDVLDGIELKETLFEYYLSNRLESYLRTIRQNNKLRRLAEERPDLALRKSKELESRGILDAADLENFIKTASETLGRPCNIHVVKLRGDMLCVYSEQ